nr:zinc knuckle CX2CX4HX4C [Tanacetum cinerariifolium]
MVLKKIAASVAAETQPKMLADVARSHSGDSGGEDRPTPYHVPTGYGGCFANRGKDKRKPNLGGRAAGRLHTRDKTRNLSLNEITNKKGPVPIRFEVCDKQTLMPLGDHAAHWCSYIGEVIRGVPLYYPSWLKVLKERKAALITDIRTGTCNVENIRRARSEAITVKEWDKYIQFWNDPMNIARAAQNRQNRAKSTVISRQGTRSLARRRDEMEMRRMEATGTYTDDEINRLVRRGKQQGHILGVGRVFPARVTASPSRPAPESTIKSLHKKVDFMMTLFKSDSKFSNAFSQFESAGASGSGRSGGALKGMEDVLENGPCMILNSPIILKKCSMDTHGLSIIASQMGKTIMLDSQTSSMCIESWGRSSFARCLIEINADDVLKESLIMGVPLVKVHGLQLKILSMNGSHLDVTYVKYLVMYMSISQKRYEPKATTNVPIKGATNMGNASKPDLSQVSTLLKNRPLKAIAPPNKVCNITTSNSYAALDDESKEDVKNVYDELANLLNSTKTGGSSFTFTVAAG